MMKFAAALALLFAAMSAAFAQNVTVIGPITPGDCPQFSSTTVIKDGGFNCNGSPTVTFANPSSAVGLTAVNGAATTAMRSDAAPPLSASVQSSLTQTLNQFLIGTGGFGFSSLGQQAALNAIMCAPTRAGDIAYWNGSNWICLAGNNSGTQNLTENASGVPAWASGSGTVTSVTCGTGLSGGTFTTTGTCAVQNQVLLNTLTATNSTTLSDTTSLTATYSGYEIVFTNLLPASNGVTAELQVHSGGAFKATGYLSSSFGSTAGGAITFLAATTFVPLSGTNAVSSTAGISLNGVIHVFNPSASGTIHAWQGQLSLGDNTNAITWISGGYWDTAATIDGFQFLFSSGNITSGTIKIYGIQ